MKITRDNMAYVYAGLILIKDYPFDKLNTLIIKHWSLSGLEYIKKRAWEIVLEFNKKELAEMEKKCMKCSRKP